MLFIVLIGVCSYLCVHCFGWCMFLFCCDLLFVFVGVCSCFVVICCLNVLLSIVV